jgi:hypothetical protein
MKSTPARLPFWLGKPLRLSWSTTADEVGSGAIRLATARALRALIEAGNNGRSTLQSWRASE